MYPRSRQWKRARRHMNCYKNYSEEAMLSAVDAVNKGTLTVREAAKQFGVPRTTLLGRVCVAKECPST